MYGLKTVKVGVCGVRKAGKTCRRTSLSGDSSDMHCDAADTRWPKPCGSARVKTNGRRCRKKNGICVVAASCVSLGKLPWRLEAGEQRRHVWLISTNRSFYDACAVLAHMHCAGPK